MAYRIKTEQFEGPLDLLLDLIEKEKIDITRVSLAKITDEYLAYINERDDITLHNLTDFLSVAAKLILVKSQALLPLLQLDEEEEEDLKELERQLTALKVFKDHAETFKDFFVYACSCYGNDGMWGKQIHFCPPDDLTKNDLYKAFSTALHTIPQMEELEQKIVRDVVSLEQHIEYIQVNIAKRATCAFSQITRNAHDRSEVVVSFLALLELVKRQIIVARQNGVFDDIVLKREKVVNV